MNFNMILQRVNSGNWFDRNWLEQWRRSNNSQQDFKSKRSAPQEGQVFILGAGPGDPELLTMKAYRLLQEADVVLYDWLVSEALLDLIPKTTQRQFVGKRCGRHSCPQSEICRLMVEQAQLGKKVIRLKGGDPSIFGRVAEECLALQEADIPYAIVPGITAASGMAAYTGMPLTDRRYSQTVRFITATLKDPASEPDWSAMVANPDHGQQDTLVFYMGLKRIGTIASRLMQHGMAADMPVAIVDQATQPQQRHIQATLATAADLAQQAQLQGPALFLVGDVSKNPFSVNLPLLQQTTA